MDHFNINQTCANCVRGKKMFRVDLSLYDADGRLNHGVEKFEFICHFCWRKSKLDFYRFSHPDLIKHLKNLYEHYKKIQEALNQMYILVNK